MNLDLRFYWTLFVSRLPIMAALFLLCAGIGVALAFKLPETYSARAIMGVEAPRITGLQNVETVSARQLDDVRRRLLTRANLLDVASDHKVFGPNPDMTPDEIVEAMRDATQVSIPRGRDQATVMTISFEAGAAKIASSVVQNYVTLILNENARQTDDRTGQTLEFYEQLVDELSTEINLKSEEIVAFKQANSEALPDSLEYRRSRESLLQERVNRTEREIANLREQRQRLLDIFAATGRVQAPQRQNLSPEEQRLAQLNAQLEGMRLTLSDTNPRVKVVMAQIAQLEAQIAAAGGNAGPAETSQETILNLQLAQIDSNIENLEADRQNDINEMDALRASIEDTAANGIALAELEREYSSIQNRYSDALAQRDSARVTQTANSSGLVGKIGIVEPPSTPNAPSSPNRPVVAAAGVGAGLFMMAAFFVLLELLNRTIRRPAELTSSLGVTPMVTIPFMQTKRSFWIRRTAKLALLVAVIIAVPLALWAIDTHYRPLDLIYDRLMQRIGL